MIALVFEAWRLLLRFEFAARAKGFNEVLLLVRREPTRTDPSGEPLPAEFLCRAIDYACVLYFKPVLCLQRSAATVVLLRRHGWPAEMVLGAQMLPFRSHAWCEIAGAVVNDKPYMQEIYRVLERC